MKLVVNCTVLATLGILGSGLVQSSSHAAELQRVYPLSASGWADVVDEANLQRDLDKRARTMCQMALNHDGYTLSKVDCFVAGPARQRERICKATATCSGSDAPRDWQPGQGARQ
ncbi:MAG: hypothetical protein Q8L66_14145 [Caulobacter sp.]|nr:hypothetical protein [Caulobacter sp.]